MKTEVFSLEELEDFARYAQRLGWRISQLFGTHRPTELRPENSAYVYMSVLAIFLNLLTQVLKENRLSRSKGKHLRTLTDETIAAIKAYAEFACAIDKDFSRLKKEALAKFAELSAAFELREAPDEQALLEIPARLRKPGRSRRDDRSR